MKRFAFSSMLFVIPMIAIPFSCKNASLEYISGKKRSNDEDEAKPTPTPPPAVQSSSPSPDASINAGNNGNGSPVAWVEVLNNGISTNQVSTFVPATIRPTKDTLDGDDKDVPNCVNPGITKVVYDFGDGETATVERKNPCDPLDVPHTYVSTGTYTIGMTVYTAENESASASIQIKVVAMPTGSFDNGGVPGQVPSQHPSYPSYPSYPSQCSCYYQ